MSKIWRHCCNIQESKVHRIQFTQRSKYKKQSYISLQYGQLSGGGNIPQPPFFPPLPSRRWADYAENSPSPGPAVRNSVPASTSLQLPDPLPLSLYSTTSTALTPSWVLPCPPPSLPPSLSPPPLSPSHTPQAFPSYTYCSKILRSEIGFYAYVRV